jgi:hypothetical protein
MKWLLLISFALLSCSKDNPFEGSQLPKSNNSTEFAFKSSTDILIEYFCVNGDTLRKNQTVDNLVFIYEDTVSSVSVKASSANNQFLQLTGYSYIKNTRIIDFKGKGTILKDTIINYN